MLVWYTLRKLQKCLRKLQKSLRKLQKIIRIIQKCRIEKKIIYIFGSDLPLVITSLLNWLLVFGIQAILV